MRASLQNLREQISREIGRSHAAALQLVERSRTRERSIQQSVLDLTKQVNSADAGLQQLQGNAESIRRVLRDFEKRAQETAASPALLTSNSSIVSRANPTATSTSPKAATLAGAGGFVGIALGSLLALFLEFRDKTFRTSAQVEQQIGSLRVGATPRAARGARKSPADVILSDHNSVFAEAFRVSWANIQLAGGGPAASFPATRSGMALGITSASTGEGKSTHALALARTVAMAGERVVLVDADLRRSGVSRLIEQSCYFTLRDFLDGRRTANEVVALEERSGVRFVPSTPVQAPWTSQDIRRFTNFVDHLKEEFDVVIIDLPPDPWACRNNPAEQRRRQGCIDHSLGPHRTAACAICLRCSPGRRHSCKRGDLERHRPESTASPRLSRPHDGLWRRKPIPSRAPNPGALFSWDPAGYGRRLGGKFGTGPTASTTSG